MVPQRKTLTAKSSSTCCCHQQGRLCPTINSQSSTLRFRLTFISYANPVGRKTFVTGFNVQPSSFVSLLLCQSHWRGVFLSLPLCLATLLYQVRVVWETFGTTTLLVNPLKNKRAQHFPYFLITVIITKWASSTEQKLETKFTLRLAVHM